MNLVLGRLVELVERPVDQVRRRALAGEEGADEAIVYATIVLAILPVAEISVVEGIAEEGDDAVLGEALELAYGAHIGLVLPGE